MRRMIAVGTAAVSALLFAAGPAAADDITGLGYVDGGDLVAEVGATANSGAAAGGGGGGSGGGSSGISCTYTPVPTGTPLYEPDGSLRDTPGPGSWHTRQCSGPNGYGSFDTVFVGAQPQVDPAELAQQAFDRLRRTLPAPRVGTSPDVATDQLVNLATWLWITDPWEPLTATASLGGVSVTVTARPVAVAWDMGDGTRVRCDGPGRRYDPLIPAAAQTTDCSHTYRASSAGQPGQRYQVTATRSWDVTWAVAGGTGGGDLGTVEQSATVPLRVAETQALVVDAD